MSLLLNRFLFLVCRFSVNTCLIQGWLKKQSSSYYIIKSQRDFANYPFLFRRANATLLRLPAHIQLERSLVDIELYAVVLEKVVPKTHAVNLSVVPLCYHDNIL